MSDSKEKELDRYEQLKVEFCKRGEVEDVNKNVKIDKNAPKELHELLKLGQSWHLIKDHCNVFGFNMFEDGNFIEDEVLVSDWGDNDNNKHCQKDEWKCFAVFTEYDYLFVNINPKSDDYGAVRRVVNNCDEEELLCDGPFTKFLDFLEEYLQEFHAQPYDEDEYFEFAQFIYDSESRSKKKKQKMKK